MVISNDKSIIDLFGTTLYETDEAVMIDFGTGKGDWIPKSQMEDWPNVGDSGEVLMQEWFAIKKGII